MATRQKEADPSKIQYMITEADRSQFVMEIPATWKVTFGWVNPGSRSGPGGFKDGHCVRVWEGEKLRAVFDGIVRLRDLSIPLARKVSCETGNAEWRKDSSGNFEHSEKRQLKEAYEQELETLVFE